MLSRRRMLGVLGTIGPGMLGVPRTMVGAAGLWNAAPAGAGPGGQQLAAAAANAPCADHTAAGELVRALPLYGDRPGTTPYGEMVGGPGLDARLFTDISQLSRERPLTPSDQVFVRTAAPPLVRASGGARRQSWSIQVTGLTGTGTTLSIDSLRNRSRPMGTHLIECAGNNDPNNFGLLSVARWDGVPLSEVLHGATPAGSAAVLVSGLDDDTRESWRSVPGASWVLPLAELRATGAFLATGMNGELLTPDHGAPVRLVVPGWYGCAWIKWVQHVRVVGEAAPITSQMTEFARRTHQTGAPALAHDYESPVVDLAATATRVEQRRLNGRLHYRVVGVAWGAGHTRAPLEIRASAKLAWHPVERCPDPADAASWSLWEYSWRPEQPDVYELALRCPDTTIRTRRLDLFFYTRRVRID